MSEQFDATRGAHASTEQVTLHALDTERAEAGRDVGPAQAFRRSTHELADQLRMPLLSLRGQEPRSEKAQTNEFMAVFSHELRNSLGAIRSAIQIQSMDTTARPATVKARVLIEHQVGQMTRLVEDLLDVSRVRSGLLRLHCRRIDLCAVVADSMHTVEFVMQLHEHGMTPSFPDSPVWVEADPARLEQVCVNLLLNAAKYTEAGGKVGLSVEQQEGEATIRIYDTGIGIAPEVLPHIFDLFVQADSSSRSADAGLGIGLALVRSLVECHGGRVTATSAGLGHGSEFTVRLPMAAE